MTGVPTGGGIHGQCIARDRAAAGRPADRRGFGRGTVGWGTPGPDRGNLRGRLDRARKFLRSRLDRRGLTPFAPASVGESPAIPARRVDGTVRAAFGFVSPRRVGPGFVFSRAPGSLASRAAVGFVFPRGAVAFGLIVAVAVGFVSARRAAVGFVFPPEVGPADRPRVGPGTKWRSTCVESAPPLLSMIVDLTFLKTLNQLPRIGRQGIDCKPRDYLCGLGMRSMTIPNSRRDGLPRQD